MIVFTATDTVSHKIFVGSTREELEPHWAQLVEQAKQGTAGRIYDAIRTHGASQFAIEEWALAESGRELRELVQEARDTLGAEPIKVAKTIPAKAKKAPKLDAELLPDEDGWSDDDNLSDWMDDRSRNTGRASSTDEDSNSKEDSGLELSSSVGDTDSSDNANTPAAAPSSSLDVVKAALSEMASSHSPRLSAGKSSTVTRSFTSCSSVARQEQKAPAKLASGRTGSANKEKRIKEEIERQRSERDQFRQQQSTHEAAEMKEVMMRIEARRLASRKTAKKPASSKRKSAASKTAASANSAPVTSASKAATPAAKKKAVADKVAVAKGKTGSTVKEKRIKEAIEAEKVQRESQKRQQAEQQKDEMAQILARLDSRSKAAESYKRRR